MYPLEDHFSIHACRKIQNSLRFFVKLCGISALVSNLTPRENPMSIQTSKIFSESKTWWDFRLFSLQNLTKSSEIHFGITESSPIFWKMIFPFFISGPPHWIGLHFSWINTSYTSIFSWFWWQFSWKLQFSYFFHRICNTHYKTAKI